MLSSSLTLSPLKFLKIQKIENCFLKFVVKKQKRQREKNGNPFLLLDEDNKYNIFN